MSFCQRNPSAGFPVGRVSAPGVSRVPPKGQVWRGFRGILISAWRVWLRSFRTVPARWPDTRISKGENEQIVNAHPEVSFCQYRRCVGFASCTLRRIFESASPQGLRYVQSRLMQSAVYFFGLKILICCMGLQIPRGGNPMRRLRVQRMRLYQPLVF